MRVDNAVVDEYRAFLVDKYRPPSRGGNTRAQHQHTMIIAGERYSFLALGARKWVYANERVSFDWEWDKTKQYRNVDRRSVVAWDKNGNAVIRGNRGWKKWRTAETRMPASRREQRD